MKLPLSVAPWPRGEVLLTFLAPREEVLERFLADLRRQGLEVIEELLIPSLATSCRLGDHNLQ